MRNKMILCNWIPVVFLLTNNLKWVRNMDFYLNENRPFTLLSKNLLKHRILVDMLTSIYYSNEQFAGKVCNRCIARVAVIA